MDVRVVLAWPRWTEPESVEALVVAVAPMCGLADVQLGLVRDPVSAPPEAVIAAQLRAAWERTLGEERMPIVRWLTPADALDLPALALTVVGLVRLGGEPAGALAGLRCDILPSSAALADALGVGPSELLRANLAAIDAVDPGLGARLRLPVDGSHVVFPPDLPPRYRMGRGTVALLLEPQAVAEMLPTPLPRTLLLLGAGLGEAVAAALDGGARVLAWERDPWMFRLMLERRDLVDALRSGRLQLLLGVDLLRVRGQDLACVEHPTLRRVYDLERALLLAPVDAPVALVAMGELFVSDLARALRGRGYAVLPWDTLHLSIEELDYTAHVAKAALVAAINYRPGLAETCTRLDVPLICWEIDPSLYALPAPSGAVDRAHIFTWRVANVAEFTGLGFPSVTHLPLAADPQHRFPAPPSGPDAERFSAPVSFVGASLANKVPAFQRRFLEAWAAWRGRPDVAAGQQIMQRLLDVQRAHEGRFVLPELMDQALPGFRAACANGADPALVLGEIAGGLRRLNLVAGLGRFGVRVWGDDGWRPATRGGAIYMGYAGHSRELNRIYSGSVVNVDIGRLYQLDIVTMRVFDVLACGGFLLTEDSPGLRQLFQPGVHLDVWRTTAELEDKVAWYLARPALAARIGQAGRALVAQSHTVQRRVDTMLAHAGLG